MPLPFVAHPPVTLYSMTERPFASCCISSQRQPAARTRFEKNIPPCNQPQNASVKVEAKGGNLVGKDINEIEFPLITMKRDFEIQKEKVNIK